MSEFDDLFEEKSIDKAKPTKKMIKSKSTPKPTLRPTIETKKEKIPSNIDLDLIPEKTIKYTNTLPSSDEVRTSYKLLTGKTQHRRKEGRIEDLLQEIVYVSLSFLNKIKADKEKEKR